MRKEEPRAQEGLLKKYALVETDRVVTGQKGWPHRFIRCGPVECRLGIGEISDVTTEMGVVKPHHDRDSSLPFQVTAPVSPFTLGSFVLRTDSVCELGHPPGVSL